MWSLTSEDLSQAKEQAQRRRAELEERYAEERKAIEAECAELETLERIAAEFAQRHRSAALEAPSEPAEEPGPGEGGDRKPSSRWRFQLAHRPEGANSPA